MPLAQLLLQLSANPSGHAYTVAPLPSPQGAYLGADALARACLFIPAGEPSTHAPLRTAEVSLQLDREYVLTSSDGSTIRARFHSLCCETSDPLSTDTFLVLLDTFLAHFERRTIDADTIAAFFRSLIRLFAIAPSRDPTAQRQGLWGELFFMRLVRGYSFWTPFWHTDPDRRFDFSAERRRVEVKTTIAGPRIHRFAHHQVYPPPPEEIVIASLILTQDDTGLSLRQLIDECRVQTRQTIHFLKLEKAVRRAAMDDRSESGPAFDPLQAAHQLAWFRSGDAPHFRLPEPPGVYDTHYRVDLSFAPQMSRDDFDRWLATWHEQASIAPSPQQPAHQL